MKLIFCKSCWDVVKLDKEKRTCKCGAIEGYYNEDGHTACVSENAISLAIGNDSLIQAIAQMEFYKPHMQDRDKHFYIENSRIEYCWVRPNCGNGNPRTVLIKDEKKDS